MLWVTRIATRTCACCWAPAHHWAVRVPRRLFATGTGISPYGSVGSGCASACDKGGYPRARRANWTGTEQAGAVAASVRPGTRAAHSVSFGHEYARGQRQRVTQLPASCLPLRHYGASPKQDMHELWRRVVFNILISNTDDHLRNHAFLYTGPDGWPRPMTSIRYPRISNHAC